MTMLANDRPPDNRPPNKPNPAPPNPAEPHKPTALNPGSRRHPGGRSCAVLAPLLMLALPVLWVAGLLAADKPDPPPPPKPPEPRPQAPDEDPFGWVVPK